MTDIFSDEYWNSQFDVTQDDLKRIEEWLGEQQRGAGIEEITRRIIRGRLKFGQDASPSALPGWVQEKHVLSWDEEEKWQVGSQVLVLKSEWARHGGRREIKPVFGRIDKITHNSFEIEGIGTYGRVAPGSPEAQTRYEYLRNVVWEKEQSSRQSQANIETQTETILMKNGAQVASRIVAALGKRERFVSHHQRWYLSQWLPEVSPGTLKRAHRALFRSEGKMPLSQIAPHISELPASELGEIALVRALDATPQLFQPVDGEWQIIKPPPPPWEQARGLYYAYDPADYLIILHPGKPLKKSQADRLKELGMYDELVELAE